MALVLHELALQTLDLASKFAALVVLGLEHLG
jgi:hypothetical protein